MSNQSINNEEKKEKKKDVKDAINLIDNARMAHKEKQEEEKKEKEKEVKESKGKSKEDIQKIIEKKVDYIIQSKDNISGLYWELDNDILSLYKLSEENRKIIHRNLDGKNLFI